MHVKDEQDAPAFCPHAHGVNALEAFLQPSLLTGHGFLLDGQGEVLVVHRHAQGIEALQGEELHVFLREVVVHPQTVELRHLLFATHIGEHLVELELTVQVAGCVHHVRLAHHPVAAICAAHHERLSVAPQELRTGDAYEVVSSVGDEHVSRNCQQGNSYSSKTSHHFEAVFTHSSISSFVALFSSLPSFQFSLG